MQQAQTVREQRGIPWIALLLALVFAAAVIVGVQLAVKSPSGTTVQNVPAISTGNDIGADQQVAGLSEAGIHSLAGTVDTSLWTSHRERPALTPGQEVAVRKVLDGSGQKNFMPTMARIEALKSPGR
ncbi:MAG TPA: hypothetical protein VK646_08780 [Actinomycetota bacterium]|nr:hypothetical protein [Actinomycetota bacterium]